MRDTERREELLVAEVASDWLERLKQGGPDVQAAFGRWLRESPRNVREFLLATAYEHALRHMKGHCRVDVNALREQYRLEARFSRPEWPAETTPRPPRQRAPRLAKVRAVAGAFLERARWKLAALSLCLALACLTALTIHVISERTISTGPGEWQGLRLADGSVLRVGPRTRVTVEMTDRKRTLRLAYGELMVYVAKDAARPFFVDADSVIARAVGTAFAVQRTEPARASIIVKEGVVGIVRSSRAGQAEGNAPSDDAIILRAGEKTEVTPDTHLRAVAVDVDRELAWVQGRLYLNGTIAEAVREMNMRNRTQIQVSDPAISQRRVTGAFDAADPVALAHTLALALPVSVVDDGHGTLLLVPDRNGRPGLEHLKH